VVRRAKSQLFCGVCQGKVRSRKHRRHHMTRAEFHIISVSGSCKCGVVVQISKFTITHSPMAQASSSKPTKVSTGGDDLDDGLELDPNLLASSDVESDGEGDLLNEEEAFELDDRVDEDEVVKAGMKRKAEGEAGDEGDAAAKRKKRREKDKERKAKVGHVCGSCSPS
jgi:hypothetical protein